jgi:hypothetical protein
LIYYLAYRIQEQAYGGLSAASRKRLRNIAQQLESAPVQPSGLRLTPGTRLIRQWREQRHEVTVLEQGFAYRGHHYASLSAIARLISGTHCSGPRFFGLRSALQAALERGAETIYTRKSSEEGLEQAFNSLAAQREACIAFIESQRHEGWRVLEAHYDDGGYSGATLERPALKRLLADIAAGKLDCVVIYKLDRLTRTLTDFAKMVEAFDARGIALVSVTQQFNTTSSMGRLTLNVLLSFAQFEREVTAEKAYRYALDASQVMLKVGRLDTPP